MAILEPDILSAEISAVTGDNYWRLQMTHKPSLDIISASIRLDNWQIQMNIAPEAEKRLQDRQINSAAQRILAKGLVFHEISHWQICPFDKDGNYIIVDTVAGLNPGSDKMVQTLANIVADLIVDTVSALEWQNRDYADAQALFFLKEVRGLNRGSEVYHAFIRLNMLFWGQSCNYQEQLKQLTIKTLDKRLLARVDDVYNLILAGSKKGRIATYLRDKRNWPGITEIVASFFMSILKIDRTCQFSGRANAFADVLTTLYEGRGQQLAVSGNGESCDIESLPYTALTTRPVDPIMVPDLANMAWSATRCYPDGDRGRLFFQQNDVFLSEPVEAKPGTGYMPDLSFWLDSSSSMGYEPMKGKGNYDLLLRTVFAVFTWLNMQKIASFLNYSVLNFSSKTISSGWQGWSTREKLHKTLFNYQGGMTSLQLAKAKQLTADALRPFKVIMVTDGAIFEERETLAFIAEEFSQQGNFVLVQLDGASSFSRKVQAMGLPVHLVNNSHSFTEIILGEVETAWQRPV